MLNSVSSATQAQAVSQSTAAQPAQAISTAQTVSSPIDTVQISTAAKAMQEAVETPAQTAREAAGGDIQAKHLLAKEAAEKAKG